MGKLWTWIVFLTFSVVVSSMDQLHIKYEWKQLDYAFTSDVARQRAVDTQEFIVENNIPMGLEVYGSRLFVTVPRWKRGVPASLNYIDLNDNSTMSPKLNPYPNWAAHRMDNETPPEIVSPFRVRADRCGRLWVIDSGKINILVQNESLLDTVKSYGPAIIVYDLKTDSLLRTFPIPADQIKEDSFFANIAVEDLDCQDTYAYIADIIKPGLIVYSWAQNESWRVTHHYFHPDPLACEFNIRGLNFTWTDAIFGLGLSAPKSDNFSTLYFHPMASYNEFSVSTEVLRNKSAGDAAFHEFKLLGSRGPNAQSSISFIDQKTGVLFYSLINLNAVACWKTTNKEYNLKSQGRIYMNNVSMVFPSDIKVDYNQTLWILSNRMPLFMYESLDANDVNFRIFSAPVLDAISHTACDITPRSDILDKFVNKIKNLTEPSSGNALITANSPWKTLAFSVIAIAFVFRQ